MHKRIAFRFLFEVVLFAFTISCTANIDPTGLSNGVEVDAVSKSTENSMVLIPAGEITFTQRDYISNTDFSETSYIDAFYLDIHEITNEQYSQCVSTGSCIDPPLNSLYPDPRYKNHPVINVTWAMAKEYCEWRGARLPSKLEWEKAASDELEKVAYFSGDRSPVCELGSRMPIHLDEVAGVTALSQSVIDSDPNIYGLHQMTGGVWEWVELQENAIPREMAAADKTIGYLRMTRWSGYGPVYQSNYCGFRCAQTP